MSMAAFIPKLAGMIVPTLKTLNVGIDQLVLPGSANDYTTESDGQGSLLYAGDDYIAYLKGITNLDLSAARYVSWT